MSNMFELPADVVVDADEDRLPQKGGFVMDSGVYDVKISMAYLEKTSGGATALKLEFKEVPFGGTVRQTLYIVSGDAKGNLPYYTDSDGNKKPLPDMQKAITLSQLVTGKAFAELEPEDKVISLYNFDVKGEVNTQVKAYTDLIGQELKIGVLKVEKNKAQRDASGSWTDSNEKQEINEVDKFFTTDGHTLSEQKAGSNPEFIERWKERNEGNTVVRYKPIAGAPTPGAPAAASPAPAPSGDGTGSLFS